MIGTIDYRLYTEFISGSYESGVSSIDAMSKTRQLINQGEVNALDANKQELEGFIKSTYALLAFKHLTIQRVFSDAIKSLNDHVLKTYKTITIDNFLDDQYLEVPLTFAQLSNESNYNITKIGNKSARYIDIDDIWPNVNVKWAGIGWTNVC